MFRPQRTATAYPLFFPGIIGAIAISFGFSSSYGQTSKELRERAALQLLEERTKAANQHNDLQELTLKAHHSLGTMREYLDAKPDGNTLKDTKLETMKKLANAFELLVRVHRDQMAEFYSSEMSSDEEEKLEKKLSISYKAAARIFNRLMIMRELAIDKFLGSFSDTSKRFLLRGATLPHGSYLNDWIRPTEKRRLVAPVHPQEPANLLYNALLSLKITPGTPLSERFIDETLQAGDVLENLFSELKLAETSYGLKVKVKGGPEEVNEFLEQLQTAQANNKTVRRSQENPNVIFVEVDRSQQGEQGTIQDSQPLKPKDSENLHGRPSSTPQAISCFSLL